MWWLQRSHGTNVCFWTWHFFFFSIKMLKCHQTHLSVCKSALKSSKAAAASISQDHHPHGVRTSWDRVEHKSTQHALCSSSDLQCVNWNTTSFMLVGKWNVRETKWSHKKHLKAHFTTNSFILFCFWNRLQWFTGLMVFHLKWRRWNRNEQNHPHVFGFISVLSSCQQRSQIKSLLKVWLLKTGLKKSFEHQKYEYHIHTQRWTVPWFKWPRCSRCSQDWGTDTAALIGCYALWCHQ